MLAQAEVRVLVSPEILRCEKLLIALGAAELSIVGRSSRPHDEDVDNNNQPTTTTATISITHKHTLSHSH